MLTPNKDANMNFQIQKKYGPTVFTAMC